MIRCLSKWLLLLWWAAPQWGSAQSPPAERCATAARIVEAQDQFPELRRQRAALQQRLAMTPVPESSTVWRIPVVVHVLYHSAAENIPDQRIYEQLQILNDDFRRQNSDAAQTPAAFLPIAADTEIEFCLANRDPSNQPTTGITRTAVPIANIGNTNRYYQPSLGGVAPWNPNGYLNIWVCAIGSGVLGFAYPPGTAPPGADGVVIDGTYFGVSGVAPPYNGGRTTTHEVGHWLDLDHLWGTGGCNRDDDVADTPTQDRQSSGCPNHPRVSCNTPDLFMNYMDYTDDACMNLFTEGQKMRMRTAIQTARPDLLTNTSACIRLQNDAGPRIVSPVADLCADSIRAVVDLVNYGSNALQQVEVVYQFNRQPIQTLPWSGTLGVGQRSRLTLPAAPLDTGRLQQLRVWTRLPNGQADPVAPNDTARVQVRVRSLATYPFFEGFETAGLPTDWSITNPDHQITWAYTTAAAQSGQGAFYLNNWDYLNQLGAVDGLTSPPIALTNAGQPGLRFDVAYARYSPTGYSDTLRVYASSDCGQTWGLLYAKAGAELSTVNGVRTTAFFPTASEWRRERIDLRPYAGQSAIQLRFEHVSEAENNLFLDNVQLEPYVGVRSLEGTVLAVRLSPNPTRGMVRLELEVDAPSEVQLAVYNALGQPMVRHQTTVQGPATFRLDASQWPAGHYAVQVRAGTQLWTGLLQVR